MSTRVKTTLGFALACAAICFSMIVSNVNTSKFIDDALWMAHTLEVRGEIQKISTLFVTAQNNIRGYHMSEQHYYLDLHEKAKVDLRSVLSKLRLITSNNELQQQNLDRLQPIIESKIQSWESSFAVRRKEGFDGIKKLIRAEEGKTQDQNLFNAIDSLMSEENRLLTERTNQAHKQARSAQITVGLSGFLACALIVAAAFLVFRDSRRREFAEANVDRFFTLSLDLLCISGMDGFFKRLSPSFSEVLGYPIDVLYKKPVTDFVHPEDVQKTNDQIISQMKGNKVLSFENRFVCADGSYRIFSWKSVPVDQVMYAVARDVTLQKKYETELMEARETAQKATMAKSSFLANMSHEIRTPLNGVVGMTDILTRTHLTEDQKKFVGAIRTSSTSLLKIVNEILDFSKIEAGQVHLDIVDFELGNLIEEHISSIGVLAHNKALTLETYIDSKIPRVLKGDSAKISQVLLNFINNAIKFTSEGKIIISAEMLSLTPKSCTVKISVQDTGIGISSEQIPMLFKPFVQADNSTARKFGGTGLGLSICKRFVEIMNGDIGVNSFPGEGSLFWMTLTLDPSELKKINGHTPEKVSDYPTRIPAHDQIEQRKNVRVLIAEDNRMNQMIVLNMMSILGYSATLAENGRDAVAAFSNSTFDIILMDQHMPIMDGVEASREIRRREEGSGKRIPIVAFTATVLQDEHKSLFEDLMDDYIIKPVALEHLEATLMKWERQLPNRRQT